jgi:hypothetical protein
VGDVMRRDAPALPRVCLQARASGVVKRRREAHLAANFAACALSRLRKRPEKGEAVMFWMKSNPHTARSRTRHSRRCAARRSSVVLAASSVAALNVVMMVAAQQPKTPAGQVPKADAPAWEAKPADTGGFVPPVSNDPFHVDDSAVPPLTRADVSMKDDGAPIDLSAGSFEMLPNGYRRVHHTGTQTLTPGQLADLLAEGKTEGLNGSQLDMSTFTDHLPENWMEAARQAAPGMRVDSYGNPIVNIAAGLPDWAQRDVDALADEISAWLLHLDNLDLALAGEAEQIDNVPSRHTLESYSREAAQLQADRAEAQYQLGNFVGQSIARRIDVSSVLSLHDARLTSEVVNSIARYLHFYEGVKAEDAQRAGHAYERSAYPADVAALLSSHGYALADVLALEPVQSDEGGIAGAGGCYIRTAMPIGMTSVLNATMIWNGFNGSYDDAQADIPLGFRYYFQPCENQNYNTAVRVSTNGYLSFHEQGGGALAGTVFSNTSLPDPFDPSGFAAAWWDDLFITNQTGGDAVQYKLEGSLGFRVFIIEWTSVSRLGGSEFDAYWFQIRLYENYPQIEFHYAPFYEPDFNNESRTVGLENFAGTAANCGPNCSNANAGLPTNNYRFAYPAAINDGCLSPTCLEANEEVFGSNFGAGGSDLSTCVAVDYPDVWYSFRSPITDSVLVTLCGGGNGYDTTLSVFNMCNGTQLACDDDGCIDLRSQLTFNAVANTTYLIRVSGYENSRGTFTIKVNNGVFGDVCETAEILNIPGTGANFQSLFNKTGCSDQTSCASNDVIDYWHQWTAPASGVARVSTCFGDTNFDTTLAAYGGPCFGLTQLACNDDAEPFCNGQLTSRIQWSVDAGVTYYIRVAGYDNAIGEYDLDLSLSTCPADIAPVGSGNGVVDVDDLVAVILAWGPCSGCAEDFTPPGGNGQVDVDDLVGVILGWGICQ